jgi:glucose-6-phosphate dehydrogenase assembly protein OpcA
MGMIMTLVIVADDEDADSAMTVARSASREHPARILGVVVGAKRGPARVDAQVGIGSGSSGERALIRLSGEVTQHAASVVLPLLLPDSPVAIWWPADPPEDPASDPLGALAQRRITDAAAATRGKGKAIHRQCASYHPGNSDLAWTRITPWRTLVAAAFDTLETKVVAAAVVAPDKDPTAVLMRGWLAARLHVTPEAVSTSEFPRMRAVELVCENDERISLTREDGTALMSRTGQPDRQLPLVRRPLGDELAEELRRLDSDQIYAEALGAVSEIPDLEERSATRIHIWSDPALASAAGAS